MTPKRLKTKYKYLTFQKFEREGIAYKAYRNNETRDYEGAIYYCEHHAQFVIETPIGKTYTGEMLLEIVSFLEQFNIRKKYESNSRT